ncbi:hypothetical protein T484DRAFT_2027619 [Baffinella frigidus]|nr:hypothetical protein T484DRAFT_2027619 [Cryptophyta sp. CCMP2293]
MALNKLLLVVVRTAMEPLPTRSRSLTTLFMIALPHHPLKIALPHHPLHDKIALPHHSPLPMSIRRHHPPPRDPRPGTPPPHTREVLPQEQHHVPLGHVRHLDSPGCELYAALVRVMYRALKLTPVDLIASVDF